MTPKERAAMQQALEALQKAEMVYAVRDVHPMAVKQVEEAITALREALDHSGEATEMVIDWEAIGKEQLRRYKEKFGDFEQAEQEPCGHVLPDGTICWDRWCPDAGTLLYTHPVRTKDLTDDEIEDVCCRLWSGGWRKKAMNDFARAVITKFKEKNK